jgi:hypothetical protein
MSTQTDPLVESEVDAFCSEYLLVQSWRQQQFEKLGFDSLAAACLAATGVHHSQARRLLERGASHLDCQRILL